MEKIRCLFQVYKKKFEEKKYTDIQVYGYTSIRVYMKSCYINAQEAYTRIRIYVYTDILVYTYTLKRGCRRNLLQSHF